MTFGPFNWPHGAYVEDVGELWRWHNRGPSIARARKLIEEASRRPSDVGRFAKDELDHIDVRALTAMEDGPVLVERFHDSPELLCFHRLVRAGLTFWVRRWNGDAMVWPSRAAWVVLQDRREARLADEAARRLAEMEDLA